MAEPKPPARYPEQEVGEGQEHSYIGEDTGEVVTTPAFQPGDTNVDETPPEVTPETTGTIRRAETDAKSRSPRENK